MSEEEKAPEKVFYRLGDIAFFKRAKKSSLKNSPESQFTGYGFGVFLGHLNPFTPDPPLSILKTLMGGAGFLRFDDVIEFLGKEKGEEVIQKFTEKYVGRPPAGPRPEGPAIDGPRPIKFKLNGEVKDDNGQIV